MHRATRAWLGPSPRQEYSMPFPRRAVRRAALGDAGAVHRAAPRNDAATPRRAARRGALAGAAAIALTLLAAACGSSASSTAGSSSSVAAGANGTLNWEWELPTSWDPVTSSAGLGRARPRPGLRLDHDARPARNGRARPRDAPGSTPPTARASRSRCGPASSSRDGTPLNAQAVQGEHRAGPEAVELQHRLGARGHLQGRREQPDQLHARPDRGRLPGARPAGRQGRDDGKPGRVHQEPGQPAHPPGRRGAVQADQLRAGLPRRPGPQPRLLGRQPDPPGQLHGAVHHPAGADPGRAGIRPGQRGLHRR